jgi:signal transduction histidine kinase
MASHEFRTPLTTIKVNTDLLTHRLAGINGAESPVKKSIQRIENEVERLLNLMNNVLTIGKIEAGRIEVNLQKINLVYLVHKVIEESFSHQEDGRKVAFTVYGKEKEVEMDPNIFEHITSNLISNAFKYSMEKEEPEVNIEFKESYVTLVVRDHGIGIPKKDLDKISESFFRASNVGNVQGSGMGLAIVNQFVLLHKGTMNLESNEKEGTTVTVNIPL